MSIKISNFLSPSHVLADVRASDKTALLRELSRRAAEATDIPADAIFAELAKREQLGSTGMGDGIAIPHARFAALKAPFGLLARLKPPIEFDAIDGRPVDLVFLLLAPSVANDHLNALAGVARRLRDREVVEKLRSARDSEALYRWATGESGKPE